MSSKTFKLSTLAAMVLAATNANAALYTIEAVSSADNENFGGPIQEVTTDNCFTTDCSSETPKVASRGRLGEAGQFINHEVDFQFDNRLNMVREGDIRYQYERYCDYQYKYKTCEAWADRHAKGTNGSGGALKIINSWSQTFTSDNNNTKGYVDGARLKVSGIANVIAGTEEVVTNSITDDGHVIANMSSGYVENNEGGRGRNYKSRGVYADVTDPNNVVKTEFPPLLTSGIGVKLAPTRAFSSFKYGTSTYVVGSAANQVFDSRGCTNTTDPEETANCQNTIYNSIASVWDVSSPVAIQVAGWNSFSGTSPGNSNSINSSVRGASLAKAGIATYGSLPILVGYNATNQDNRSKLEAAVFYPTKTDGSFTVASNAWRSVTINGAKLRENGDSGDWFYSSSVANAINENMIVIGSTKRGSFDYIRSSSDVPAQNGSRNNRLWVADASSGVPTATYLSGGIFFDGAGGEMRAINNHNEIVGKIHAETHREVDGKMRRERGFIEPYTSDRKALFNNQAWWLDDLTNGSDGANNYRIIDANDINDAGMISATAMYCAGGYKTTSHNSTCAVDEKRVAVKLVPIADEAKRSIQTRSYDQDPVVRQGAGLGWLFIGVLTLFGFRRK